MRTHVPRPGSPFALDRRACSRQPRPVANRFVSPRPIDLADLDDLPGHDAVMRGIAAGAAGRPTQEAYLVAIIARRLEADGVTVPHPLPERPKDRLWEL